MTQEYQEEYYEKFRMYRGDTRTIKTLYPNVSDEFLDLQSSMLFRDAQELGIVTYRDVYNMSPADLLALNNVGAITVQNLLDAFERAPSGFDEIPYNRVQLQQELFESPSLEKSTDRTIRDIKSLLAAIDERINRIYLDRVPIFFYATQMIIVAALIVIVILIKEYT